MRYHLRKIRDAGVCDDERRINYELPKIGLRYVVTMALHQGYCLTSAYSFVQFYCPKVRRV